MKFIFSFLFGIILLSPLSPAFAAYNPGNENCAPLSQDNCSLTSGCEWVDGMCGVCVSGTAGAGCVDTCSGDPNDAPLCSGGDTCWTRPDGAASCNDWICANGYTPADSNSDGNIDSCIQCTDVNPPQHAHYIVGDGGSCAWACDANYYKDNNTCQSCPDGSISTTGYAQSITDCTCTNGYLINDNGNWSCGTCDGGMVYNGTTHTCGCPDGQYVDGGTCKSCPAGTSVNPDGGECYIPSNTLFCDKNGQNCMKLISD